MATKETIKIDQIVKTTLMGNDIVLIRDTEGRILQFYPRSHPDPRDGLDQATLVVLMAKEGDWLEIQFLTRMVGPLEDEATYKILDAKLGSPTLLKSRKP